MYIKWLFNIRRLWERRRIKMKLVLVFLLTSAAVMLGNEELNSLIVYSRTKTALFGYGWGTVATSHIGSVKAPLSAFKFIINKRLSLYTTTYPFPSILKKANNKMGRKRLFLPGKTDAAAPTHAAWNQAYEKYQSKQQIFLARFVRSTTGRIDYKTQSAVTIRGKC